MAAIDKVRRGLEILEKYGDGDVSAEHDIIYAGSDELDVDDYAEEDRAELGQLGWFFQDKIRCWARFV